ncbi:MAG: hypothetical protein J0L60_04115 [Ignavibacteria bacterium]|nr:hypothetical protein [Ignavibacteria bacterium]
MFFYELTDLLIKISFSVNGNEKLHNADSLQHHWSEGGPDKSGPRARWKRVCMKRDSMEQNSHQEFTFSALKPYRLRAGQHTLKR